MGIFNSWKKGIPRILVILGRVLEFQLAEIGKRLLLWADQASIEFQPPGIEFWVEAVTHNNCGLARPSTLLRLKRSSWRRLVLEMHYLPDFLCLQQLNRPFLRNLCEEAQVYQAEELAGKNEQLARRMNAQIQAFKPPNSQNQRHSKQSRLRTAVAA